MLAALAVPCAASSTTAPALWGSACRRGECCRPEEPGPAAAGVGFSGRRQNLIAVGLRLRRSPAAPGALAVGFSAASTPHTRQR